MIRYTISLFLLVSFSLCFGQKTIYKTYDSQELKDLREVVIHLPKGYQKDSLANFPLALVLDGEKLFDLYVGNASYYASQDNAPEQIVVGINTKKTRNTDLGFEIINSKLTPEARSFYLFIRDELIPYVEANYRTSPFLTVVGSGLSANFITYFLKESEPIFNAYVCLNPTLAPDITNLIQTYRLEKLASQDNTFYFYLSGSPHSKTEKIKKVSVFGDFMNSIGIKNFNVVYDPVENTPTSTASIAEGLSKSFAKIFEIYSGITKDEYDKKIKDLSPPDAIAYLETKYLDIEYLFGTNMGIRKRDIIAIENIIIEKDNGDYLKDYGEMILKLFPKSEMGHFYLGKYYELGKDYKTALREYRTGYGKMDPNDPNADLYYQNVERVLKRQQ